MDCMAFATKSNGKDKKGTKKRVAVTGAGGRTGELVLKKLMENKEAFEAIGTARTEASAKQVTAKTGAECMVLNVAEHKEEHKALLEGVDVLVICSSATPKPNYLKLLGVMCQKYCLCQNTHMGTAFGYPVGGMPQQVDWEGGNRLIHLAKAAGIGHVIYVGSMGGTKPDHFLNKMGGGNILLWKRKAEMELIASGLQYTIIHPGGLLPHMGNKVVPGGQRELVVGVNDKLMDAKSHCIPREDLAQVVVQAALEKEAIGRVFDLVSQEPGAAGTTVWDKNLASLLATIKGENYTYAEPKHPILFDN